MVQRNKKPIKKIDEAESAVRADLTEYAPVDTRVPKQVTQLEDGTVREDY